MAEKASKYLLPIFKQLKTVIRNLDAKMEESITSKAWSGRFTQQMDSTMEDFNSSVHFDWRLYKHDIKGSLAYAKALQKAKILNQTEYNDIRNALAEILQEVESGTFVFKKEYEDVHMNIEANLIKKVGDAGKKIHTGRSRNDQVATDIRLYLKDEILTVLDMVQTLQKTIIKIAEKNTDVIMPGYTHMQKAQPILFSHHIMAYYYMLKRDSERLKDCFVRSDVMPLGSAALAGTSYDIDRNFLAKELDFAEISKNSIDAVSDRDFVIEFVSDASIIMMHLSRMAEEIVLWSTAEFGYIELSDSYSTGSSIMPQKKNPDVAELTRGKTGRVFGSLMATLTIMKALPLSYNRDMQEDKEQLFNALDTVKSCLSVIDGLLSTMKINKDKMYKATEKGCLTATDLADYLVCKGLPFREAHEVTGKIVRYCIDNDMDIYQMSSRDLRKFSEKIDGDIHDYLTIEHSIDSRDMPGGTSRNQVIKAIKVAKDELY